MKRFLISFTSLILIVYVLFFIFLPLPGQIPVLMYHFIYPDREVEMGTSTLNVGVNQFKHQMWLLKLLGFHSLSLDEYYEIKSGQRKPRGKEILITFDDGHKTYLNYALPILEQYNLKSANFLIWRYLVNGWHDYMSADDVKHLLNDPLISFGSHTITHPKLIDVPLGRAKSEIFESKDNLEKMLKQPILYFAYPSGSCNDDTVKMVEDAGYRLAFRVSRKLATCPKETNFSLLRIKVNPHHNLFVFWVYASGLHEIGIKIKYKFLQLTGISPSGKLNV